MTNQSYKLRREVERKIVVREAAIAVARLTLHGVVDKQGQPLMLHVARVAQACRGLEFDQYVAAWLHDSCEDGGLELSTVGDLFGAPVGRIVDSLTRRPGEAYIDKYIRPMVDLCPEAVPVKVADLRDNLDEGRGPIPESLRRRYERALEILERGKGKKEDR